MGVPAFFRWLTKKYPSVIVHCIEDKPKEVDGVVIPVETWEPNPNGVEFDNLYLDMNGIIHPCTHPEDKPAPKNEDEMMIAIFECIDRLFRIVRPRKVLYMAIDGVAPRAKMNQQRSRRFRASKEVVEKIKEMDRIREELMSRGCELPPAKPKGDHFDSNCITPGTPFMDRLSKCLHYYIHDRLNNDGGWKGIKVILSDANVPGEGEHKIMDYIRRQRAQPDHDPNTSHCLCGADADLIMLGLATHEPNFTIIREEFKPNKPRPCDICGQLGHEMKDCLGIEKEKCGEHDEIEQPFAAEVEFIFVRINVLREYLAKELEMVNLPFTFDLDRAIDDWVFMCFFVGNDFLPHLPSLEIRENAIDRLVNLYKKTVYKTGGWLTDSGVPDLTRVQLIMSDLGEVEDEIFRNRQQNEVRFKARMKAQKKRKKLEAEANSNCYSRPAYIPHGQFAPVAIGSTPSPVRNAREENISMRRAGMHTATDGSIVRSNKDAAAALKSMLIEAPSKLNDSDISDASDVSTPGQSPQIKRKYDSDEEEEPNDEVRLWEAGFKDRYYESKFDVQADNYEFRQEVASQYVKGLAWVLRYYYQGCASWEWYFPYHYAPFASDFINIGDLSSEFPKNTKPFSPLEQLMGVFPAASRSHVPAPWGELMLDPESPIIDFYPEDFQIDLNGKKFAWQGVALLPFVDEVRLKQVLAPYYDQLTDEERRRNIRGDDRYYVKKGHSGFELLHGLYENSFSKDEEVDLDTKMFQGCAGKVLVSGDNVDINGNLQSPINGLLDVMENLVVVVRFRDPKYDADYVFPAVRLEGAIDPPKVLKPGDLTPEQSRNWRPMIGMTHSNQRASLDSSGHRTLAHEGYDRGGRGRGGAGQGPYSNMAPPAGSYVHRNSHRGDHRSRPYDVSQRGRGYSNSRGGGGYNNWSDGGGRGRGGYNSGGGGYGGHNNSRGGGYQGGNSRPYGQQGRGGGYQQQSYGYSTTDSQSYSSQQPQQGRPYSNVHSGGAYGASSSSQQWRDRSDRDSRNNERDGGRRQDGYYTSGYTTTTGSGNGNNSRR